MRENGACNLISIPKDLTYQLLEEDDAAAFFKARPRKSNKGDFGYVALVGGSFPYSGAIRLASMANCAMRAGAGVASAAVPGSLVLFAAKRVLEATVIPLSEENGFIKFRESEFEALCSRYRVIAVGMGMGNTEETRRAVEFLVRNYDGVLLIDADGLNALSCLEKDVIKNSTARLVLTPHIKEFSRLSGLSTKEISDDPAGCCIALAKDLGCVVLLKGAATVVSDGKTIYVSDRGCAGMAVAGSGDVLSGILSAILANSTEDLAFGAAVGAYVNGMAGELAQRDNGSISMVSSDTAGAVGRIIKRLETDSRNLEN